MDGLILFAIACGLIGCVLLYVETGE